MAKTPAWQRKEGQSPSGGLNAKGRASAKAEGHNLKPPQPEGGPRKNSFCARMTGMKEKLTSKETANDPDSRINKSLRKWNCHADGGPVWDRPRPKKLGKPEPLSSKEKKSAKAMAKAAGRPYPNLVDNMRAARAYGGVVDQAMEFVRRHRQEGGELEGDVQFAPSEEDKLRQIAKEPSYADYFSAPLKYGVETMVSPDIAPQRAMKALVEAPETAKQFAQGAAQSAYSGATLPGDVAMGRVDPMSDEGFRRAQELAGLAQTGSFGFTRPAGSLASGASRPTGEFAAAERAMEAVPTQTAYQRMLTDIGHYSPAAEAASTLKQEKGPASQMLASLRNLPGVKPEELKWSGIESAFQPNETVTRQQIMDYMHGKLPRIEETTLGQNKEFENLKKRQMELNDEYSMLPRGDNRRAILDEEYDKLIERKNELYEKLQDPRYEQYSLPGGENYREVLMHLPKQGEGAHRVRFNYDGENIVKVMTDDEIKKMMERGRRTNFEILDKVEPQSTYQSSHWNEPNVLGHLRMSDRTGPEGEKILHLEELQSDWGQEGRKKGFYDPIIAKEEQARADAAMAKTIDINFKMDEIAKIRDPKTNKIINEEEWHRLARERDKARKEMEDAAKRASTNIPSAPYVTNTQHWTDLGLKRALREAAEGGYDKMIWTPGAEQAARYDLSKQIDRLVYNPNYEILMAYKDGKQIINRSAAKNELEGLVGKDVAKNLLASEGKTIPDAGPTKYHILEGQDLSVGGEGMKSFYDKVVPTQLSKLIKKLDPKAKIEMGGHTIDVGKGKPTQYRDFDEYSKSPQSRQVNAHVLHITPELRKRILEGLPAYADGGAVESAMNFVRKNKSYA